MHNKTTLQNKIEALGMKGHVTLSEPHVKGTVQIIVGVEGHGTFHARNFEHAEAYVLGVYGGRCQVKAEAIREGYTPQETTRCADCGEEGETIGHMTCQYPQDHN